MLVIFGDDDSVVVAHEVQGGTRTAITVSHPERRGNCETRYRFLGALIPDRSDWSRYQKTSMAICVHGPVSGQCKGSGM
jgi:hypothetical protein